MSNLYILIDKKAVPEDNLFTWLKWFENHENHKNRVVKQEQVGKYRISTVFLGIDHNFFHRGDPILFETMVFGPDGEALEQDRCRTWEEAETLHNNTVNKWKNK